MSTLDVGCTVAVSAAGRNNEQQQQQQQQHLAAVEEGAGDGVQQLAH